MNIFEGQQFGRIRLRILPQNSTSEKLLEKIAHQNHGIKIHSCQSLDIT